MLCESEYDWPLDRQGRFVVSKTEPVEGAPLELVKEFSRFAFLSTDATSIYLRGSMVEAIPISQIYDADIVIVGRKSNSNIIRSHWTDLQRKYSTELRLDLRFVTEGELFLDKNLLLRCMIEIKGKLLEGKDVFAHKRRRKILGRNAKKMIGHYIESTNAYLEIFSNRETAPTTEWLCKRAIRLGGLLALPWYEHFSRYPTRCAEIICERYPEMKDHVQIVLEQLFGNRLGKPGNGQAYELWEFLISNSLQPRG